MGGSNFTTLVSLTSGGSRWATMGLAVNSLLSDCDRGNSTSASQSGEKDSPLESMQILDLFWLPMIHKEAPWMVQRNRKPPPVNNLTNWLIAFSKLMAVLALEDTSHEEGAGMAAHLHTILQLHHDLGEYWKWAAVKVVRVCSDLNMSIYGRCLPQPPEVTDSSMPGPSYSSTHHSNNGHCTRPLYFYLHACELCRGPHTKLECPLKQQRL